MDDFFSMIFGLIIVLVIAVLLSTFFKKRFLGSVSVPGISIVNNKSLDKLSIVGKKINDQKESETSEYVYVVKKGDSLWKIAQRELSNGNRYLEVAKANKLGTKLSLEVGQKLILPKETVKTAVAYTPTSETKKITGNEYTIKKGDSLANIALRAYGDSYAWTRIWKANSKTIENPGLIFSGNKIVIPR